MIRIPWDSATVTPTATGMLVTLCGTISARGHYTKTGTFNGKLLYINDVDSSRLFYDGVGWVISDALLYNDADFADWATPDLVTNWDAICGSLPLPAVVAG